MKRFAVFLLAGLLVLSLASCSMGGGGGDTSPSPSASPSPEASPSAEGGVIDDMMGGDQGGSGSGDQGGQGGSGDQGGNGSGDQGGSGGDASGQGGSGSDQGGSGGQGGSTSADFEGVTDVKSFFGVVESAYETDLPSMMELDEQTLQDTYGIDPTLLDEYVAKIPMMNVHATEFFAAKVKSGEMDKVVEGINSRLESLDQTWANYLPDQYELVKNHQLVQEGDYVLLAIGTRAEEIAQSFRGVFADK